VACEWGHFKYEPKLSETFHFELKLRLDTLSAWYVEVKTWNFEIQH